MDIRSFTIQNESFTYIGEQSDLTYEMQEDMDYLE
jgi:hypothetical protein